MYRKLWLKNGVGNEFTFTEKNAKQFLSTLEGLGFAKTIDGYTLGNVTKVTSSSYTFPNVTGELLFYADVQDAYQDYFNFVKFISLEPLQLYYLPPNTLNPYYCSCELIQVQKGEYGIDGIMRVPVSFQCTSHWLNSNETAIVLTNEPVGTGKYYDLERPYYYAGTTLQNISLTNNGSDAVGMIVEIVGDVTNPQYTLTQNSQVYGSCKINGSYDYVKVNSKDGEQSIYLELDGSAITNPAVYQDLSISGGVLTFIKLKTGTSTMAFTCGNIDTFNGTLKIRYSGSFVSV